MSDFIFKVLFTCTCYLPNNIKKKKHKNCVKCSILKIVITHDINVLILFLYSLSFFNVFKLYSPILVFTMHYQVFKSIFNPNFYQCQTSIYKIGEEHLILLHV